MLSDEAILAKGNGQTLNEHRTECLERLSQFRQVLGGGTEEFLQHFNINIEEFWHQLSFLVSNHDFGKLNSRFQEKIRAIYDDNGIRQRKASPDIPHNFISPLYFTNERFWNLIYGDKVNLCAMAAMHHHGPLLLPERGLYDRQEKIVIMGLDEYLRFYDGVNDLKPPAEVQDELRSPIDTGLLRLLYFNELLTEVENFNMLIERRWIFPLLKQYLHLSDWAASGASIGFTSFPGLLSGMENVLIGKVSSRTELREKVQEISTELGKRAILSAPTGSGKTEAAIRWAFRQNKKRLIFSLPTRSLVDDIYYRFQGNEEINGYFPGNTGVLHGASDYTIRENFSEDPDSHEFDRYFHRPVMVTTIDQILFSLFNIGKWDAVNFALAHGCLVIDEVHAYDKVTLSLIVELLRQTKYFDMPVLLMTATLPSWIPVAISRITGEPFDAVKIPAPVKGMPWRIHLIDNFDPALVAEKGKENRVLVVVNNVRECVGIYSRLKDMHADARCLHSRFIQRDRKDIIEWAKYDTKKGKILVSTQVIEAGIDIDYDILITEISPADTLIQRAGRVNRSRDSRRTADIYVYEPDDINAEINDLVYGKGPLDRTRETLADLTAEDTAIQRILDHVYPENDEIEEFYRTYDRIHRIVQECESFSGKGSGNKHGDGLHSLPISENEFPLKTRESRYVTIDAVPAEFQTEASAGRWREYAVRVPLRPFWKHIDLGGEFPVINLKYSRDTGLELSDSKGHEDAFFI